MGVISFIAKRKAKFRENMKQKQDIQFKSNMEKLAIVKKERKELEKRENLKQQLAKEEAKVRNIRFAKVRKGVDVVKKAISKPGISSNVFSNNSIDSSHPFAIASSNPFQTQPKKKAMPKAAARKKRVIIEI